jgi:hypothetical protein
MAIGQRNDPKPLPPLSESDVQRFYAGVDRRAPGECWTWKRARQQGKGKEYGLFKAKGKMLKSSRVAYFLHNGIDPAPHLICHTCDNPPCCNPAHLFAGSQDDNRKDCKAKGRTASGDRHMAYTRPDTLARGSRNGNSKTTEDDVKAMRRDYATGLYSQEQLGERYGLHQTKVSQIVRRVVWRHVP